MDGANDAACGIGEEWDVDGVDGHEVGDELFVESGLAIGVDEIDFEEVSAYRFPEGGVAVFVVYATHFGEDGAVVVGGRFGDVHEAAEREESAEAFVCVSVFGEDHDGADFSGAFELRVEV